MTDQHPSSHPASMATNSLQMPPDDDLGRYLDHLDGKPDAKLPAGSSRELDDFFNYVESVSEQPAPSRNAFSSLPAVITTGPTHAHSAQPTPVTPQIQIDVSADAGMHHAGGLRSAGPHSASFMSLPGDQFLSADVVKAFSDVSASTSPYLSAAASPFLDDEDANSVRNMVHTKSAGIDDSDAMFSHTIEQLSLDHGAAAAAGFATPLTESNLQQQQQHQGDLFHTPQYDGGSHHSNYSPNQLLQPSPGGLSPGSYSTSSDLLQSPYDAVVVDNPEQVAAKTPSLFSRSPSRCSSSSNLNNGNANGNVMLEGPTIQVEDISAGGSDLGSAVNGINGINAVNYPSMEVAERGGNLSPQFAVGDMAGIPAAVSQDKLLESYSYLSLPEDAVHDSMRVGRQQRRNSDSRSSSRLSRSTSRSSHYSDESALRDDDEDYGLERHDSSSSHRSLKNPAQYACQICDKKFTRPYNLKSHLRTHTNERPYLCAICGKAFARQHDKKRHEDLHSGEKRFQCRGTLGDGVTLWGCGKRFARTDALRRHFQTESGKSCIRPLMDEMVQAKKMEAAANGTEPDLAFDAIAEAMENAQASQGRSPKHRRAKH